MSKFLIDNLILNKKEVSSIEELNYQYVVNCCNCDKTFLFNKHSLKFKNKYYCNFCIRNNLHLNKHYFTFDFKNVISDVSKNNSEVSLKEMINNHEKTGLISPCLLYDKETFKWFADLKKISNKEVFFDLIKDIIDCFKITSSKKKILYLESIKTSFEKYSI